MKLGYGFTVVKWVDVISEMMDLQKFDELMN